MSTTEKKFNYVIIHFDKIISTTRKNDCLERIEQKA